MRLGVVFTGVFLIIGAFFTVSAVSYVGGALLEGLMLEKFGITGGGHIVQILLSMLVCVMVIATLLTLAERKWSAFMQDRTGPNRARIALPGIKDSPLAGLPHIATDVIKMLTKEAFRPATANKFLFNLAPMLAFAPAFALFAIVPTGPTLDIALPASLGSWAYSAKVIMSPTNPDAGLLLMFAVASLAVYGTSLAGWSSNNKFALLGGVRASSQMVSYEVALGLSLVGMMAAFSTVRLAGDDGMAAMQARYLWSFNAGGFDIGLPAWGIFLQPAGFILFFAAAFAETKRAPFDSPEGESEIVGYFLEYSGMQFGLFMISEFVEVVVLSGVLAAIFFGGWSLPFGNEWLTMKLSAVSPILTGAVFGTIFWVKVVLLCYLQLVIRWTFPRFRYDQIQTLGWKILLPLGLVNLFVSGALILRDPSLKSLAIMGIIEIVAVAMLTLTPPRQVRREQEEASHGGGHGHDDHGHDDHGHDAHDAHGHAPAAALPAGTAGH